MIYLLGITNQTRLVCRSSSDHITGWLLTGEYFSICSLVLSFIESLSVPWMDWYGNYIYIYIIYSVDVLNYFKEPKTNTWRMNYSHYVGRFTTSPSGEFQSAFVFLNCLQVISRSIDLDTQLSLLSILLSSPWMEANVQGKIFSAGAVTSDTQSHKHGGATRIHFDICTFYCPLF